MPEAVNRCIDLLFLGDRLYKSSAVAEMGDRLATIEMGRKVAVAVPLSVGGGAGSPFNTMWPGRTTSTKSHLDPSSRLVTTDMGRKLWSCDPFLRGGEELGLHLTQCRLSRGIRPYQVAS